MTTLPQDIQVSKLDASGAFQGLTKQEQLYAYHLAKASWEGAKICLFQCSYESPAVFTLLQLALSSAASLEQLKADSALDEGEWADFLTFAAGFYGNMGNFKSFGDIKIKPACSPEAFYKVLQASPAFKDHESLIQELWDAVREPLYSTNPVKELGFPPDGTTGYYSSNCVKTDAEAVQAYMDKKGISGYNTRLFKLADGTYQLRQAAAEASQAPPEEWDGYSIVVNPGDYGPLMARIVASLSEAKKYAANPEQEAMLEHYIASFTTGSIESHKEGSRQWIRDKGPAVESYIGFIESYRDPFGSRGEWEGFVAVVNRDMSQKFAALVEAAESFLALLPWPPTFEKDRFLRPDFTSLDVVAFASSGIPSGINIPNYDDIRQNEGFKNVSLGNVLSAALSSKSVNFLSSENGDEDLFRELIKESFEVQVGLHELLGHGSGKMFQQAADGTLNFDPNTVLNPQDKSPIKTFYKPGETWDSKFPVFGSSYEECRAECVGIYLCVNDRVLSIFGHEGKKAQDILYINWLNMARAGLMALEFYRPENGSWGQAHMQARFAILRVLLEAGQDLVTITPHEEKGVIVSVDREKIMSVGVPAIGAFLQKLQVYKSTADYDGGRAMYVDHYTQVPPDLLQLRDIVLAKKKERPLFVQPHLSLEGNEEVKFSEFEASLEGVVESFRARYPALDEDVVALWRADKEQTQPLGDGGGDGSKRAKANT